MMINPRYSDRKVFYVEGMFVTGNIQDDGIQDEFEEGIIMTLEQFNRALIFDIYQSRLEFERGQVSAGYVKYEDLTSFISIFESPSIAFEGMRSMYITQNSLLENLEAYAVTYPTERAYIETLKKRVTGGWPSPANDPMWISNMNTLYTSKPEAAKIVHVLFDCLQAQNINTLRKVFSRVTNALNAAEQTHLATETIDEAGETLPKIKIFKLRDIIFNILFLAMANSGVFESNEKLAEVSAKYPIFKDVTFILNSFDTELKAALQRYFMESTMDITTYANGTCTAAKTRFVCEMLEKTYFRCGASSDYVESVFANTKIFIIKMIRHDTTLRESVENARDAGLVFRSEDKGKYMVGGKLNVETYKWMKYKHKYQTAQKKLKARYTY